MDEAKGGRVMENIEKEVMAERITREIEDYQSLLKQAREASATATDISPLAATQRLRLKWLLRGKIQGLQSALEIVQGSAD